MISAMYLNDRSSASLGSRCDGHDADWLGNGAM